MSCALCFWVTLKSLLYQKKGGKMENWGKSGDSLNILIRLLPEENEHWSSRRYLTLLLGSYPKKSQLCLSPPPFRKKSVPVLSIRSVPGGSLPVPIWTVLDTYCFQNSRILYRMLSMAVSLIRCLQNLHQSKHGKPRNQIIRVSSRIIADYSSDYSLTVKQPITLTRFGRLRPRSLCTRVHSGMSVTDSLLSARHYSGSDM